MCNCVTDISNQYNDNRYLRKVCGILGIIKLINVKYLVVATHREFVGVIDNQVIWRLAGHDLIPFTATSISLSDVQVSRHCSILHHFFFVCVLLIDEMMNNELNCLTEKSK